MNSWGTEVKFLSLFVEQNIGWFSALYFNGLFRINFLTKETEYIGEFPEKKSDVIYRYIVACKEKLFFTPCQGDSIGVYDRVKELISCINIPQFILNKLGTDRFAFAFEFSDYIYMFGYNNSIIVRFDIKLNTFTEINVFGNCEEIKIFSSANYILTDENKIYTFINGSTKVIEITLEDFSYKILKLYSVEGSFISMAKRDDILWITDTAGELFEYNLKKEEYHTYLLEGVLENPDENTEQFAWNIYISDNKIYLLAGLNHASFIFDMITKCFKKNNELNLELHKKFSFWTNEAGPIWFLPTQYNDKIYFQWEADLTLRVLDLKNNQVSVIPVLVNEKYYGRVLMKQKLERDGLVTELEEVYSLDSYLDELRKDFAEI